MNKLLGLSLLFIPAYAGAGDAYFDLGKIEVEMPGGTREFAALKVEGRYQSSDGRSYELYSPYVEIAGSDGKVLAYPLAPSPEVKRALCAIANGERDNSDADPAGPSVLTKPVPTIVVQRDARGFTLEERAAGATVAGNIPCLKNPKSFAHPGQSLAEIEITRKSDGTKVRGSLRAVAHTNNPQGLPLQMFTPHILIEGIAYDIWAGRSGATAEALCRAGRLADRNVGLRGRPSATKTPAIVYKDQRFYLYENLPEPVLASFLTCGGNAGGDGS